MQEPRAFTLSARLRSFVFAGRGLRALIVREHNARLHALAAVLVIAAGVSLRVDIAGWALLALAIALVLGAEAFNAALESLADAVAPEPNALVGRAKDLGAAAVLVSAIGAAAVGGCVFVPRIAALLAS
jgi:diacylglycerol kinase (ATP)